MVGLSPLVLLVVCLAAIFAVDFSRLPLVWIISIHFLHVLDYCLNLHWSWVALSHFLGWSFTFCWLSPICSCGIWASRSINTDSTVSRWQPSFTGPLSPSWYGTSGRREVLGSTITPELSRYCRTLIGWIWALSLSSQCQICAEKSSWIRGHILMQRTNLSTKIQLDFNCCGSQCHLISDHLQRKSSPGYWSSQWFDLYAECVDVQAYQPAASCKIYHDLSAFRVRVLRTHIPLHTNRNVLSLRSKTIRSQIFHGQLWIWSASTDIGSIACSSLTLLAV